jgi:uncharacterized protein YcfJ
MSKFLRAACIAALLVPAFASAPVLAQGKSNVQRERCAQLGERAVSSQSRKDADTASVVGALVIGGIIGAVIVNGMNEKSARDAATNQCLAKAGLLSKDATAEVKSSPTKSSSSNRSANRPSRSARAEAARTEVGAGSAWMRRSIRSQQ